MTGWKASVCERNSSHSLITDHYHQQLLVLRRGGGRRDAARWGTDWLLRVEIGINEVKVIRCFTPDKLGILRGLAHSRHP